MKELINLSKITLNDADYNRFINLVKEKKFTTARSIISFKMDESEYALDLDNLNRIEDILINLINEEAYGSECAV